MSTCGMKNKLQTHLQHTETSPDLVTPCSLCLGKYFFEYFQPVSLLPMTLCYCYLSTFFLVTAVGQYYTAGYLGKLFSNGYAVSS